jgi:hypothetical protein
MPLAIDPKTGSVLSLGADGAWSPAQTAVNPETKEMLALDGEAWRPMPASKGVFQYIDDAVRSLASGATFGWADEFAAKMDELTGRRGQNPTGVTAGKSAYEQNLAREQARDAQIPIAIKLPGEVAGAVGTTLLVAPLAAWKAIAHATSRVPQWARFAGLGATEGGLAGAGGDSEDRLGGAAKGAAIGAPIGAVTPTVVTGVTAAARGIRNALMPETGAAADIGRAIARDQTTPAALTNAVTQTERPGVATLADVGGENVRGLVERVAQTPGAGRSLVVPALTERQEQQLGRISTDLRTLTGTDRTAVQATQETIASRQAAAQPLYTRALEAGDKPIWSPELERLSGSPTVQEAMKGAVRTWQDNVIADGYGAMNPGAMVEGGGILKMLNGKVPALPNLQFWDYTKRIIDDQIGTAIRAGQDQKVKTLTKLASQMRTELDKAIPEYAAARQSWAGPTAYLNAIEDGRNVLTKNVSSDEFGQMFRSLTGSEQDGYRIGAVSSIISKIGNDPAKLADLTKYLRSPEGRAKITSMMPSEQAAQAWDRRLNFEVRSSELVGKSLGNSATARRLAEAKDQAGIVGDLVMDALMAGPGSVSILKQIFTAGPRWLRDTLRSRTDREIADILTNPGRAGDLQRLMNRAPNPRAAGQRTPAALTAGGVSVAE